MALVSAFFGLVTVIDTLVFTATVRSTIFLSIHNEPGSRAYVSVFTRNGVAPASTTLFAGGVVFPVTSRALGQDDLLELMLEAGDSVHAIVEKGDVIGNFTVVSVP